MAMLELFGPGPDAARARALDEFERMRREQASPHGPPPTHQIPFTAEPASGPQSPDEFVKFMANVERARKAGQQQQAQQPRPEMPRWSRDLSPADFTGETRRWLERAQAEQAATDAEPSMPQIPNYPDRSGGSGHPAMVGNAAGDRGTAAASPLGDVGRNPSSSGLVDSILSLTGNTNRAAVVRERTPNGLSSKELSDLVPFDTRPPQSPVSPDTRQRLHPEPAQRRLSPASEPRQRIIGQEVESSPEAVGGDAGPQQAAREAAPQPATGNGQPFNSRRDMIINSPGDAIRNMREMRRTGQLPPQHGTMAWRGGTQPSGTARALTTGSTSGSSGGAAVQPASQSGGGGSSLFGGDGPGIGYLIGGLGAALQEAGGQEGAMGDFVDRYRKYVTTNKTAKHAKKMGVPDDEIALFMMAGDGPGLMKHTLAWKQAQREAKQPDYGFMNVDGTVIRTDKRGGTVSPVYEGAGGQTIPGTTIAADSSMGEKYQAYVNQGFDHETALGAASGRYDLKVTDTGIPVKVDTLTNQEIPIQRHGPTEIERRRQLGPTPNRGPGRQAQAQQSGQAQQQGQTDALGLDPRRDRTLYELADSGTGFWNIAGDFLGRVTPQFVPGDKPFFTDQRQAVSTIQTANRGLIRALQQSPRYAEGERTSIEREIALNPSVGMSPEAWRESAVAVDGLLRQWWQEDMQDAQSNTLASEDRQRALASARAIERYLQLLGVPQDGGQGAGAGQPHGQGGGGQGGPVTVTSPDEAQALPPGTPYRTPDGQLFRR